MKTKEQKLLETAQANAATTASWADLSNFLFDENTGLLARAFPNREDRAHFIRTPEYKAIRNLVNEAQERTGLVEGATPTKSGKFVVRLPKSLHCALEQEADGEGVSLNQLVVTKLAIQLRQLSESSKPQLAKVAQAYLEVRDGYSIDRIVADPELDRLYLHRCRELGLSGTDFDLNWLLFTGRKNKEFSDLPKTKNYTPAREDDFAYASEMAFRHLQETMLSKGLPELSLDKIICDPQRAAEFDKYAAKLAPGFTSLEYRWIALGIRKAAGRNASKAIKAKVPAFDFLGKTTSIRESSIPRDAGIYFFRCDNEALFIGETDDLRNRISRHYASAGKSGIPDWLYDCGKRQMSLGVIRTPDISATTRKVTELGAILNFKPVFNILAGQAA